MPFPPLNQPSMALGLLTAALRREGVSVRSFYPCLDFAEMIGLDGYAFVSDTKQEFLIGEWIFGLAAFREEAPDEPGYLDEALAAPVAQALMRKSGFRGDPRAALHRLRAAAAAFVDETACRILALQPRIVGCTSTFMQHVASLALLRRVKELAPEVVTVIGGANCEAEMGAATQRCFPWVDCVVSGEADLLFPELCRCILAAGSLAALPPETLPSGVLFAGNAAAAGRAAAPRAVLEDMNRSPTPDFDDYFDALAASPLGRFIVPGLALETSRGCWWGKKHHCTFCGLNGGGMTFRSKHPDRVVCELAELSHRHGIRRFNVVDNILDLGYIDTVLPRLAKEAQYTLFFETKSNLRRDQLERIAAAGIRRLQPGIESMHDEVLRLVDKGVTALQNLRLLKWARELGVFITWNFLWDVPGERDDWYAEVADWLPRVSHLQPPGIDRIQFHRFSPYQMRPAQYGLELAPFPTYRAVYPVPDAELEHLAYYFIDPRRVPAREALEVRPGLKRVIRQIALWNRTWLAPHVDRPVLIRRIDASGAVSVEDTRPGFGPRCVSLGDLAAAVLLAAGPIATEASLLRHLGPGVTPAALGDALAELDRLALVLRQGDRILALTLDEAQPIPDAPEDFPGGYVDIDALHAEAARDAPASAAMQPA
jgi:magnesium-protoporphyrin IX monomethyl ester (oxidative) cyclase